MRERAASRYGALCISRNRESARWNANVSSSPEYTASRTSALRLSAATRAVAAERAAAAAVEPPASRGFAVAPIGLSSGAFPASPSNSSPSRSSTAPPALRRPGRDPRARRAST